MKKAFYEYLDLVKTNPLIYNTLKFDQYSRFAISLNIFLVFDQKFENEFEISKKLFFSL